MATYSGTPRTWTAGETVTAALMNSDVRDPLAALAGSWTAYTPTLGGFTAGSGSITGAYIRVGKYVTFRARWIYGSGSAAATAIPTLSLPVTAAAGAVNTTLDGAYFDASVAFYGSVYAYVASSTGAAIGLLSSGYVANCSTSSPFTWTTGDGVYVSGTYEAA